MENSLGEGEAGCAVCLPDMPWPEGGSYVVGPCIDGGRCPATSHLLEMCVQSAHRSAEKYSTLTSTVSCICSPGPMARSGGWEDSALILMTGNIHQVTTSSSQSSKIIPQQ